jgi:Ras-related protein Rab-1A
VKLEIWDTAGQERFHTITTSYYRSANGIVVVYDITNRESFDSVSVWFNEAEKLASPEVCKLLIGNKSDLVKGRAVAASEGVALAKSLGIPFLETSAKSKENVWELFMSMGKAILDKGKAAGRESAMRRGEAPGMILGTGKAVTGEQGSSYCFC